MMFLLIALVLFVVLLFFEVIIVSLLSYSLEHIGFKINNASNCIWCFTGLYDNLEMELHSLIGFNEKKMYDCVLLP